MTAGSDMWAKLEGDLYYLGRPLEDVWDVVILAGQEEQLVPLFTTAAAGETLLQHAPDGVQLLSIPAADFRAKEELLRAALAQGATSVRIDPADAGRDNDNRLAVDKAIWYLLSFKQASACL